MKHYFFLLDEYGFIHSRRSLNFFAIKHGFSWSLNHKILNNHNVEIKYSKSQNLFIQFYQKDDEFPKIINLIYFGIKYFGIKLPSFYFYIYFLLNASHHLYFLQHVKLKYLIL